MVNVAGIYYFKQVINTDESDKHPNVSSVGFLHVLIGTFHI